MIDIEQGGPDGFVEIRMTAPVTGEDYTRRLLPALDRAIAASERVRLLAIVEADVSDFTLGAMLQDARAGLKHWSGFDRAAVVTDNALIRTAVGAFSVFMPCPVARFERGELDAARRWLRESLGAIHQEEIGQGALHVRLRGKLDAEAYERDVEDLNRFMAGHDRVRLLVDLREFDGWQGFAALRDHLHVVRGHAGRVARAAVVGDAGWQEMAVQIGRRAFGLDARYFDGDQFEAARTWLLG